MTKIDKKIYSVFNRYILIFILGLSDLVLFYFLFTKPTVLVSNFLLNLVSPTILFGNTILFKEVLIELVKACIAGSAYYLLIILALAVPNIKVTRRLKLIGFLFVSLFIFNTL
ncbi:pacearchaeosortase, partial [archaeon]|nr:pacearchaeosortase [archaeon]